jgi:hypothetical protein
VTKAATSISQSASVRFTTTRQAAAAIEIIR